MKHIPDTFNTVKLSDLNEDEKDIQRGKEQAYRRGYTQGYWNALKDTDSQPLNKKLDKFYLKLLNWRYKSHKGKTELPPLLNNKGE